MFRSTKWPQWSATNTKEWKRFFSCELSSSEQLGLGARLIGLVTALIFVCSCTQHVNVVHSEIHDQHQSLDIFETQVEIQWPDSFERKRHVQNAVLPVGLHNRWKINIASTTPIAVAEVLKKSFTNVTIENSLRKDCAGCGMIVRPKITRFGFNKITMQSTVELELNIFDAHGNFVHTFKQKGKSPATSFSRLAALSSGYFVPFSSTLVGKPVVNATVKSALDDALEEIELSFENESQTGGVLARVWRPKKESYGEHEFTAEKLARRMGCDLRTDGVNLVESNYGRELYDAFCFEHGRFQIACEFGRCAAHKNPERSVASQTNTRSDAN